jgi:hypothetical protein
LKISTLLKLSALALPALLAAAPAAASFSGTYTVTFYIGPSHTKMNSQCVTFTNTGNVAGFPDSGTFASSTFADWGGNFVVDGRDLRWYSTFDDGSGRWKGVVNAHSRIKNDVPATRGGFDEWDDSEPPINPESDGITKLVAGCGAPIHHGKSPVRD